MAPRDPCDDLSTRAGIFDEAARRFIGDHLELVGEEITLQEALYVCPWSGQLWLADLPDDATGSFRLRVVQEHPSWYLET
jgi:hypothetical protein